MSDSATGSGGPVTQGYTPLTRMQEKASQLRQELEVLNKNERHAQFKRNMSIKVPGEASTTGRSGSRRLPRSSTMASSAAGVGRMSFSHLAMSLSGLGAAGASNSGPFDRPGSAAGGASRMSSRRASNASGANTDVSGDERPFGGGSRSPSRRGGARSPSRTAAMRDMQEHYAAAISRQNALEDHAAELENRVRDLTSDNERRQESYMRREAQLQGEIGRLEDQLRVARGERPNHPAFGKATTNIKELHAQVVEQIEGLLDAQAAALRTEEHSALRRFTARLNELEGAVAAERGKPNKEDTDWMEKTMALRNELETTQNIAQILDKKHALLAEENGRLRSQFKLQEEDREYLIKQTVALKKENAALRNQLAAALQEVATLNAERDDILMALEDGGGGGGGSVMTGRLAAGRPMSAMSGRPMSAVSGGRGGAGSSWAAGSSAGTGGGGVDSQIQIKIQRYEDVIESLKKLLEGERRRTKQARAAHTLELQQRTSLQAILRQCIDDVRERRRVLEAEGHREHSNAERAQARSRPLSARGPGGSATVSRPLSGTPLGAAAAMRRPGSAALSRPGSGRAAAAAVASAVRVSATGGVAPPGPPSFSYEPGAGAPGGGGGGGSGGDGWGADGGGGAPLVLSAGEREQLVEALLANEEVLKVVFDKTFPGVAPHPPSDPYLDRMAAWQEQREAQVVANAKVLAATKNGAVPSAAALAASTPGGALVKEAAARPWVLNVDAMLSDFLGGGGGARGGAQHGEGAGATSGGGAAGR
ncbi:hypothetical protein CHLRE_06g272350v5 [Chlamydomonas reinhardtii]|uniref:Uncharacterized protein n=1 Tax=Chlamydomonas reinhardtii TaxID=3055 RepID=A0A2K3DNE6_CHLRE|nr:uncharacterized protein CHLRE_06g272350v5 [Chlamydomonas reinhardtii]PNW82066.1 hypothetical protein CHLRE_06g272350v5 [Chlamydomonas reinhardtii]